MKNFKLLIPFIFLSIFALNTNAEVLIPSEEDKESLIVYLVKNPQVDNSIFTRDIDNNLTFSKNSYGLNDGVIDSNACFLIDLSQIDYYDFLNSYYDENDANLYLVESVYTMYGIENLAKILSEQSEQSFIDFAISLGLELKVETLCKNNKTGNQTYLYQKPDIFLIPGYLYNLLKGYEQYSDSLMTSLTADDILLSWTFDEMKSLSDNYLIVLAEEEKSENEFQQRFANLAEEKSKEFMGSLYLNANEYGSQNFCTLRYSGDDAVAAIGYRLMGDEMIIDKRLIDYFDRSDITLNFNENSNRFEYVFDDISEAFLSIKPKLMDNADDYCNIFVDYPENLLKLKNAIERDVGWSPILGSLFDKSITDKQYAIDQGFDDYDQYSFAYQIDADYRDVKSLGNYQIFNLSEYNKVQEEIITINYSHDADLRDVLAYLDDLSNAKKQNMNVNEYKDARVKEEERLAKIAREAEQLRQAEFAKEYPYTAILTCGMGGGDHINIVACFVGGSYGVDTELEITNGQNYQMYKPYNLSQAGSEYYNGLEINLKDSFTIIAQNSSENLLLSLEIVDNATGMKLYEDSASQYGVVSYRKY